jgi:hypothetical protein
MDIEELVIETLRLCEHLELEDDEPPNIYTCMAIGSAQDSSAFNDVAATGELCVCAHNPTVATFIFFLMQGVFDHPDDRLEWYTQHLEQCLEYDEITPEVAIELWTARYAKVAKITEHNITQPIVTRPMDGATVTLTPSICDIWTLPRIRRQFTD